MTVNILDIIIFIVIIIVLTILFYFLVHLIIKKSFKPKTNSTALEDNLRDERQKSSIILNAIEDGVMLIDKNQIIQLFNPGAANITGWSTDEAVKLSYKSILKLVNEKNEPYTDQQDPVSQLTKVSPTIRDNAAILITKNSLQIPISISASLLLDQDDNPSGKVVVMRDVTKERQEEKQRTEFISTASHEMRTPVAAIEGYLSLALNDKVSTIDTRAREYLEKAHQSTQHLGQLFQDLLTSAKAEDGRLASHPVIIEISEYLEKLVNDLRFVADKKALKLDFVIGKPEGVIDATGGNLSRLKTIKPLYYIKADPDRIREVITNLFDNAVKYTEQGTITIGLKGDDQNVQIYIHDMGIGIPKEDIPHLFQKFYRVDSSATRIIGGTGLGLFISKKIIELYQGKIWVDSVLGKGSTFYINLPRIDNQLAEQEKAQEVNMINI